MASVELIAKGLRVPEGPAVLPNGQIIFTQQIAGEVSLLADSGVETLAYTAGAPNSVVPGGSGELYVCQNGGVVGAWLSPDRTTPGLQIISADGVSRIVSEITGHQLIAPNDLAFRSDGRLSFTDPAQPYSPDARVDEGYIYSLGGGVAEERYEVGGVYCNGVAFDGEGRLYWVESYTGRVVRLDDGAPNILATLPEGHLPDGFTIAADGRIYIASTGSHTVDVLSPEGEFLDAIMLDDDALPTNVCFRDSELWVTDFGMNWVEDHSAGRLWKIETDAVGIPPHYGSLDV